MTASIPVRFLDRTTPPHIATLVLLAGMSAMNMSIFLPALPAMTEHFGTNYGIMQLSVSLYLVTTAVLQLLIGPLSDRYGRRPVVLTAAAIFIVATLGCILSTTIEMFLVFRMLQAVIAVGIVLSRAIVRDIVPMNEAASMIGYVTMGMALIPMVAPIIGGGLTQLMGWELVFIFLLACGCGVLLLCYFDQGETNQNPSTSLYQQFRDYPELLLSRRFWGYALSAAFASATFFAFLGGAPYAASEIYGLSPAWTGAGFGIPAIGYSMGNFFSGRYSARVGINQMMVWGAYVTLGGIGAGLIIGHLGFHSPLVFFASCYFIGLGNGLIIPNSSAGLLSVRPHLAGTASGLGGSVMIGGGAALSVLAGIVLEGAHTSLPLQWLMFCAAVPGLLCTLYVIRREKQLGLS